MANDIEVAFRQILKSVVREVFDEVLQERRFQPHQNTEHQQSGQERDRFLLRAREAAKRLAISERHLFKLTNEGAIPCVRIGRLVHYSVETIERWIRETESTGTPERERKASTDRRGTQKAKSPPVSKNRAIEPKRKRVAKPSSQNATNGEIKRPSRKRGLKKDKAEPEEERRIGPFDLLLKEIGVYRDSLPPITNGDLMRIAEVDIPTLHGWQWHNRALPDEAVNRLKDHFIQYRLGKGDSL